MTVYSPYQDSIDYVWYVNVMTPNGVKKQEIENPLYYFQMMNVKPPIGSKFSEETIEDYQSLCAEAETENLSEDYSTLEPYMTLNEKPFTALECGITPTLALPTVYMSINAKSSFSSSVIQLTTPFVSIKPFNSSKTQKKVSDTVNSGFKPDKHFEMMEIDEIEQFGSFESYINKKFYDVDDDFDDYEDDDFDDYKDNNDNFDFGELGFQTSHKELKNNTLFSNSSVKPLSYHSSPSTSLIK